MRRKFCYKPPIRSGSFCDSSLNRLRPEGILRTTSRPFSIPILSSPPWLSLSSHPSVFHFVVFYRILLHTHTPSFLKHIAPDPLFHITPVRLPDGCFNLTVIFQIFSCFFFGGGGDSPPMTLPQPPPHGTQSHGQSLDLSSINNCDLSLISVSSEYYNSIIITITICTQFVELNYS